MEYKIIKSWKDTSNRRWYLTNVDTYPYPSSTSLVAIAKSYRYKDFERNEKSNKRLQQAGKIGTDIHSVLEYIDRKRTGLPLNDIDIKLLTKYNQIIDNYEDFLKLVSMNEGEVIIREIESQSIHPVFKYAGRKDRLVTVGNEYEIWDFKTAKSIHEEDGWQLVSYMEADKYAGIPVKRVRIIHIDKVTSKITDLKYVHHEYMFNKFLSCIELFKGIYFNDLLKGRINDIDELGVKYKFPLEELTKNYVLYHNITKGDNNMELTKVTMANTGTRTKSKDPNVVSFPENEPVMGTILGEVKTRIVHKAKDGSLYECSGKNKCDRCKLGMTANPQILFNFLTLDEKDTPVIKIAKSEAWGLFYALGDAFKSIQQSGGVIETAVFTITRSPKGIKPTYKIENIAPKHKAFLNIAETIKTLEPFPLVFDELTKEPNTVTVNRSDFVENKDEGRSK